MQSQKESIQNVVAGMYNIEGTTKTLSACLGMQLGSQEKLKLAKEVEAQQKDLCCYNNRKRKAKEVTDIIHIFHGARDLVTRV